VVLHLRYETNRIVSKAEPLTASDVTEFEFQPTSKEEALAEELAERLGDPAGLPYYLTIAQLYPESEIRHVLGMALEVPEERIRTSRGAFFNWLVSHHAKLRRIHKEGETTSNDRA